ncbi:hypothetical protein RhiirA4_473357 [Rhizophagus irregularis]|uniref:RNI-like protein n=1 Tax=Rhizophagus irregularis TaxID=588596 RepID=A0A2I1H6K3_9GLOM|nr:hypothetical protein RhiirA4_473357 [Rhizophagus irregularis]
MADFVNSDALYEMAKICKSLNIIIICEYSKKNYGLISLVNAQRNLKEVLICNNRKVDCKELTKALEKNGVTITKLLLKFPDLQILDLKEISCFKELAMLIRKTKGNIIKISINLSIKKANNTGVLIEAIAKHCPNIEELSTYLEPKDFIHVKSLLLNCRNLSSIMLNSLDSSLNMNG